MIMLRKLDNALAGVPLPPPAQAGLSVWAPRQEATEEE